MMSIFHASLPIILGMRALLCQVTLMTQKKFPGCRSRSVHSSARVSEEISAIWSRGVFEAGINIFYRWSYNQSLDTFKPWGFMFTILRMIRTGNEKLFSLFSFHHRQILQTRARARYHTPLILKSFSNNLELLNYNLRARQLFLAVFLTSAFL